MCALVVADYQNTENVNTDYSSTYIWVDLYKY